MSIEVLFWKCCVSKESIYGRKGSVIPMIPPSTGVDPGIIKEEKQHKKGEKKGGGAMVKVFGIPLRANILHTPLNSSMK